MAKKNVLEKELAFFNKNKAEYLKQYKDKFILIKGLELVGSFDTDEQAYKAGIERFGNQPFLIKQVFEQEPTLTVSALYVGIMHASL
jgi:hypothetical protein